MAEIKLTELMGENVKPMLKFCGKEVRIYPLTKIIYPEKAELDDFSIINDYCFIDAGGEFKLGKYSIITWHCLVEGRAKVYIGDRCFVGPGSKFLSSTYKLNGYYTCEFLPDECHDTLYGDIIVKDDAYIGANVTIMPGVTIGEGAVVGANALINKDLEPLGIYVGTPCKKIGEREKPTDERRKIVDAMDWSNHL